MDKLSRRSILKMPLVFAMTQQTNLDLPPNLPRPKDDGGARHLKGMALPDLALPSTSGRMVNLSKVNAPRIVIYAYPMTGRPDRQAAAGLGRHPRRARLHAGDLRLPRSPQGSREAARRGVRHQHAGHAVSAGDGEASRGAVRGAQRRALRVHQGAAAADLHRRRHDAEQAPDADCAERTHRTGLLSGVPARQARRRSDRLAEDSIL